MAKQLKKVMMMIECYGAYIMTLLMKSLLWKVDVFTIWVESLSSACEAVDEFVKNLIPLTPAMQWSVRHQFIPSCCWPPFKMRQGACTKWSISRGVKLSCHPQNVVHQQPVNCRQKMPFHFCESRAAAVSLVAVNWWLAWCSTAWHWCWLAG